MYNSIYAKIKDLEGWLTADEAGLLYRLAAGTSNRGRIIEIGSWKGRSTICLALGAQAAGHTEKIVAIDPHTGSSEHHDGDQGVNTFADFRRNIKNAGVEVLIEPLVATSRAAADDFNEQVELAFIDGAHEYEFVRDDFEQWFPKVICGGVMAFHDTLIWSGPRKVAAERLFKSNQFKNTGFTDSIAYGTKVEKNDLFDRARNRYVLLLKNIFEVLKLLAWKMKFLESLKTPVRKIFKGIQ
jgi:predicted O-methyltransferase YrrM